jgi:S-adenosylhomocysteine hydrolase
MEVSLSRVINPEGAGKERNRLVRSVVLALRMLMRQTEVNETSRNLAAYVGLSLCEIYDTVESSVAAWEKKGYWVKADRYRMEWEWCTRIGNEIKLALLADDWAKVAILGAQVGQKLANVEVRDRNRLGTPWDGAWSLLTK